MLRNRFTAVGQAFVEAARGSTARGGVGHIVTGAALPGSPFATPWRIERGALLDLGPHLLDLMDAAMGRIEHVDASGDPLRWISMVTHHEGGALGSASLSITTPGVTGRCRVEVFTDTVRWYSTARSPTRTPASARPSPARWPGRSRRARRRWSTYTGGCTCSA